MLIGVAGLAGTGKTTATCFLERAGLGQRYYAGDVLHEEVRRRGIEPSPANERAVREEMREKEGKDVFARFALPQLRDMLSQGWVFLDAVYCIEELKCYDNLPWPVLILTIDTCKPLRVKRLALRNDRRMTAEELERRDQFELSSLGLNEVLERASFSVPNNGNLTEFEEVLQGAIRGIRTTSLN